MRAVLLIFGVLCIALLCVGCLTTTMPGPGGVTPGMLFNSTTAPGDLTNDAVYQAYPDSFKIIGMVEGSSSSVSVLGLFSFGNGSYRAAIDAAKTEVGADGLINCVGDVKGMSFLGLFSRSQTVVRGLAIKRR